MGLPLANLFLEEAKRFPGNGAARFIHLREARDLAARAGDLEKAFQAAEEMARSYAVKEPEMKAAAAAAVLAAVKTPEAGKALTDALLGLTDQAVAADDYDLAGRLAALAEKAARRAKELPLVLSVQRYERSLAEARQRFARLKPFADRLRGNPEDDEANLEMGRYLCLVKGDWERGLSLLAQGSDRALRLQAQRDLAGADTPEQQVQTGDAWWRLADDARDQVQLHLRQRAVYWYEQAVSAGDAATRTRLEERIAATPRPRRPGPAWDHNGPPGQLHVLNGHNSSVFGVAFSPDGRKILSGSVNNVAMLWDAATGKQLLQLNGHGGMIWGVAYGPRGRHVFTASWDGTVKMWDAAKGNEVRRFPGQVRIADINGVAVSRDGKRLLTGSDDGVVRLWDVATGGELKQLRGHNGFVYGVDFSPDGRYALSGGSNDQTMILWDLQTGQAVHRFNPVPGSIRTVAFSPDGRTATCSGAAVVQMWDLKTFREVRRFVGHTQPVQAVAFSPDGRRLLTGGGDSTVRLWDAATGRQLHSFTGHTGMVFSVAFSPGGGRAVSGGGDNTVRVWGLPR